MKGFFYMLWQWTWGFLQTVMGAFLLLLHIRSKHYFYHGAVVTEWKANSSAALGMFIFVTKEPIFSQKLKREHSQEELRRRLLVHEYGHTVQSLLLGPLFLLVIGLPSALWAGLPALRKLRRKRGISYYALYTEKWANSWGKAATGENAMGNFW